jgi:predicted hotdog family 3-hydroxylacyl-ACP dehydratase
VDKIIEKDELMILLPHKGKMLLLSRILDYMLGNGEISRRMIAEYDITPDCLFYDSGFDGVPTWASFEFMAQCISALSGLESRIKGKEPKLGLLLSVSNMKIKQNLLMNGSTVLIRVKENCRLDSVYTFDCEVVLDEKRASSARITVMDVDDVDAFREGE